MRFVIVSPRQKYGGAIVLHTLCKNLSELGYDASVYYIGQSFYKKGHKVLFWIRQLHFLLADLLRVLCVKTLGEEAFDNNKKYIGYVDESIKGTKQKYFPWVDKETIVVYPDIVYGNFLRANKVVRWLLYYNRYGEDAYEKNDLFYAYRDIFNDEKFNPQKRILTMSYHDLDLYKKTNYGDRNGKCYIIRKGASRTDLPKFFDGPIIDDLPEKRKVEVMNQCEFCVSYDTQTSYSSIAAICGCISVIIPEEGKTWNDYRGSDESHYGIALGFDEEEIEYAKNTTSMVLKTYEEENKKGKIATEKFVKECTEYFKK